jgi:hypothetical protein
MGLSDRAMDRRMAEELLVVREGYTPAFRPVADGFREGKPHLRRRLRVTERILESGGNGKAARTAAFEGEEPRPVRHRPGRAALDYPEFLKASVAELEAQGACVEYTDEMTRRWGPPVLTELGVAPKGADGLRMTVPAMYVNCFARHEKFTMDALSRAVRMFDHPSEKGTVRDVKAGFLQSLLHESCWRFACFPDPRCRSRTLCFVHNHFGFSWSPLAFWKAESLDRDCYRRLGLRWQQWVDDSVKAYRSLAENILCETYVCTILKCCGVHMALKGRILAQAVFRYSGMTLNTHRRFAEVPAEKLETARCLALALSRAPWLEPRAVAGLAGKIISYGPGLRLARALARLLYQVMRLMSDWSTPFRTSPPFVALFVYLAESLPDLNRRAWDSPPITLEGHVDASETGIGAWFVCLKTKKVWRVVYEYTAGMTDLVKSGRAHSSWRESFGYFVTTRIVHEHREMRAAARNGALLLRNDNSSSVQAAETLGTRDPFMFLYALWAHLLAERSGFAVMYEWQRRSEGGMPEADALSKPEDVGDVRFNGEFLRKNVEPFFGVRCVADLMATRESAVAPIFWTRYLELGSAGTNFLRNFRVRAPFSGKNIAWIYPPFHLVADACKVVRQWRIDCLLVHPMPGAEPSPWKIELSTLPVTATMKVKVPRGSEILKKGRGVPERIEIYPKTGLLVISRIEFH